MCFEKKIKRLIIASFAALFRFSQQSVTPSPGLHSPAGSKNVAPVAGWMCVAIEPATLSVDRCDCDHQD